jgi:hypothetical protein
MFRCLKEQLAGSSAYLLATRSRLIGLAGGSGTMAVLFLIASKVPFRLI